MNDAAKKGTEEPVAEQPEVEEEPAAPSNLDAEIVPTGHDVAHLVDPAHDASAEPDTSDL